MFGHQVQFVHCGTAPSVKQCSQFMLSHTLPASATFLQGQYGVLDAEAIMI